MILMDLSVLSRFCRNSKIILLIAFLCFLTSCVTQRSVEYIKDINLDSIAFNEPEFPDYRLKPNDELYIRINSLDEAAANVFSNISQQQISIDPYGTSLLSYSIDKEGYLLLPVIGNIQVRDKTLAEVSLILRDSLSHILNRPAVVVKLVNRYITILGEVRNPGHYVYSQERLSIFDAIGLAGDINDYGRPDNVILVRNENGENIRVNIDLTKSEMLTSSHYFLRPNDILYVKPLRNKFWGIRQVPLSILFSTITTGLLIFNLVRTF
jgi:polysaccharide biosynthesis/export protein